MDFFVKDWDYYIDGVHYYKRGLVHRQLNNKPILLEARDLYELTEKINKAKTLLNSEWSKFELKKEYEKLTYERLNLLKKSLQETEFLKWNEVQIPLKIFSTDIIKYNQLFYPIAYYVCGKDSQKFKIINNDRYYSDRRPIQVKEKYFYKLWYTLFKDEKKLDYINQTYYNERKAYNEDLNRYRQLLDEQKKWRDEYKKTIAVRLRSYYLQNPLIIQKEVHNLLIKSNFHYRKGDYKNQYFNYSISEKKVTLVYLLPPYEDIEHFLKEPNYDALRWQDISMKEEQERMDLIFSQLILILISEQFIADKLKLIDNISIKAYSWELNPVNGNYGCKKTKELDFSRKEFEELNFENLEPSICVAHHVEKYKNKIKNIERSENNDKLHKRLSSLANSIDDIPYNIDVKPSINTNIETLNNNDGGVVNFKK